MMRFFGLLILMVLVLVGCGENAESGVRNTELSARQEAGSESPAEAIEETAVEVAETVAEEAAQEPAQATAEVVEAAAEVTEAPLEEAEVVVEEMAVPQPVEVEFFTPAQQEGPYYTVEKPVDRDNDLVTLAGAAGAPVGEVLEFNGTVFDANGLPVEGAVVEIWQTDASGVYLHPNDPGTANRDRNFQFYGEAQTDAQGMYAFRTLMPGHYEPRPRHIHVKVRLDGQEVLTTQFYFAEELDLQGAEALMLIAARPGVDEAGNAILAGERDIFLNVQGQQR